MIAASLMSTVFVASLHVVLANLHMGVKIVCIPGRYHPTMDIWIESNLITVYHLE